MNKLCNYKKETLLGFLIALSMIAFGQQSFFCFDKISARQAPFIEQKFNSETKIVKYRISISDDYIPNGKELKNLLSQPLIFNRPDTTFTPYPQVMYFFLSKDSTVKLIEYAWDSRNSDQNLNAILAQKNKESNRSDEYNKKFESILENLKKILGIPSKGVSNPVLVEKEGRSWTERISEWHNDNVNVELIMIWSGKTKSIGTYKIVAKIYWT